MNAFLWNVMLALTWIVVTGDFSLVNFGFGFGVGFLILFFTRRAVGTPNYTGKVWKAMGLAVFFIWELILANLRVAYDVVTPRHLMRPGVISIPLDARTDTEITLLANLITLTPGTLSLDVSADRKVLYIHAMYIDEDVDMVRRKIKNGFERRILELLR